MLSAWREIDMSKVLSEAEIAEIVNARNGMPATGAPVSNRASTSTHHLYHTLVATESIPWWEVSGVQT